MQNLYRTADIAKILGVEEWRIKNFSQGKAYNLEPSIRLGSGQRRWRVYTSQDVLKHAIAGELVRFGFGPEAVGKALDAISESQLTSWTSRIADAGEQGEEPDWKELPLLVNARGDWKVMKASAFEKRYLGYGGEWAGVFVLNYPSLLGQVIKQINEYEGRK